MSCPFFYPLTRIEDAQPPARSPLGCLHDGSCTVDGAAQPTRATVVDACNFGYGRGQCVSFPDGAVADAVRFTDWQGATLYILEKDYSPVEHGDALTLTGALLRQAQVFAAEAARMRGK